MLGSWAGLDCLLLLFRFSLVGYFLVFRGVKTLSLSSFFSRDRGPTAVLVFASAPGMVKGDGLRVKVLLLTWKTLLFFLQPGTVGSLRAWLVDLVPDPLACAVSFRVAQRLFRT